MYNEGRKPLSVNEKNALYELIKPQLDQIKHAVVDIEEKIGVNDSWSRSVAITWAAAVVFDNFSNIVCGLYGWSERRTSDSLVINHSSSCSRFIQEGDEQALSQIIAGLVQMMSTEQYELIEHVQRIRRGEV